MSPCADAISRKRSRREEPSRLTLTLIATRSMPAASLLLFVGTYTSKDSASRGLYSVRLDSGTGALSQPVLAAEAANPTFLALHPAGRILYALGEIGPGPGAPGGGAVAYQIDSGTGRLAILNSQATGGGSGTHLAVDPAGKTLGFVSYGGGQVTSFPLANDGRIGPRATTQVPAGPLGPNPARQDKPHPHSVTFSPDGRFAYVCDLGLDRIFSYRIDSAALEPAGKVATAPGAGPRHGKFSADGNYFYGINELDSTIATYACDRTTGALTPEQAVSTLPEGFSGGNVCAEIRLHPNDRFVYGSNRGHDSLAVFARHPADGTLARIQIVSSGGAHPRNFALSPDGHWLVCANRDSHNLVVFKVDSQTGRLAATGHTAEISRAVCVLFGP